MNSLPLSLSEITENPDLYTYIIESKSGEKLIFRPLLSTDVDLLTVFLEGLSSETRRLSTFDSYDKKTAIELCDAIAKYDKLRFVLESSNGEIVGLFEMTMDIPQSVIESYKSYGVELNIPKTCRFGPTLADAYQGQGVGSAVFSHIIKVAKEFGKNHIMLYGGVLADNTRAIHYYQKQGFKEVGRFIDENGKEEVDMILDLS